MKFKPVPGISDLINSEGPILSVVESSDPENPLNERLYLRGLCLNGKGKLYVRVTGSALELFFQGRISVNELFMLREDEPYFLEYNGIQSEVWMDEEFRSGIIGSLQCGDAHYYSLPAGMRLENPFQEVLSPVDRDYIYGLGAVPGGRTTGRKWMAENLARGDQ